MSASGAGREDTSLRLWDVESGQELRRLAGHTDAVRSVVFLPDGRRALSGGQDGTVRLWDVESAKELNRFETSNSFILSLAVSA